MNSEFKELIKSALSGNEDGYDTLYELTKQKAYYVALSIAKNEYDAKDILQESYLKAFSHLAEVNPPEKFDIWLNQIVANESKNYIKKKRPELFSDIEAEFDREFEAESSSEKIPHEAADNAEKNRLITQIINELPDDERLIVLMYYYQEMKTKEIAKVLNIPLTTVKYKLLSARKKMKEEFERLEKNGTKLYAVPLLILPDVLKNAAEQITAPSFQPAILKKISASAKTAVNNVTGVSEVANGTGFFATAASKVLIGVLVVAAVGGIAAAVVMNMNHSAVTEESKTSSAVQSSVAESGTETAESQPQSEGGTFDGGEESSKMETEDFRYSVMDGEVTLTKYIGKSKEPVIPETIDGYPVTTIGWDCFEPTGDFVAIEKAVIPGNIRKIVNGAFSNNDSLKQVTFSEGLTEIGDIAFYHCHNLESPELPESLKIIGTHAFAYCEKITDMKLPKNVEEIGESIFEGTKYFEDLPEGPTYLNDGDILLCFKTGMGNADVNKITVQDGTRVVAGGALSHYATKMYNVKTIEFPESVEYIGKSVCNICPDLETVVFPDVLEEIPSNALTDTPVKNVNIPSQLKSIGSMAFYNCENISSIELPDTMKEIGSSAFQNCSGMTKITIPEGVEQIGESAFEGCEKLVLYVKKGSYAETYAKESDLKYENY